MKFNYRQCILLWLICGMWFTVMGQKNDYVWLSGYRDGDFNAQSVLNFNSIPIKITSDTLDMNFAFTDVSFCDSSGSLLFYTNGIYIANALDEKIENSDSLNAGWFQYVWDPYIQYNGYRTSQGMLTIENVSQKHQNFLLHTFTDSLPGSQGVHIIDSKILLTLLDMSSNTGHGKVLYKNKSLIEDTIGYDLSAIRHGNGRDWWVLVQNRNTNCYYRILIDSTGVHLLTDPSCAGLPISFGAISTSCFSTEGSMYINLNSKTGLNIYDFDRCTGLLSNGINLPIPAILDSGWIGMGVAISPNNRYLYVSLTKQLYQFDLTSPDIFASIDTVGLYDGHEAPFGSYFNTAQIGPDGKIYINCGNAESDFHVIEQPDRKGDSCYFKQHGVTLPSFCAALPNFPNYRLGRLPGSACDTLWSDNDELKIQEREKILKVFPNPASNIITIDYGFTDWSRPGEITLEIVNELGQIVYGQLVPQYSGFQRVDVSRYSSGMYTTYIKRGEMVVAVQKFARLTAE